MWCARLKLDRPTRVPNQSSIQSHLGEIYWPVPSNQPVTACSVLTPPFPSDDSTESQLQHRFSASSGSCGTDSRTPVSPCESNETTSIRHIPPTLNITHSHWCLPSLVLFARRLLSAASYARLKKLFSRYIQQIALILLRVFFSCRIFVSPFDHEHSVILSVLSSCPLLFGVSNPHPNGIPVSSHAAWNYILLTLLSLVTVADGSSLKTWTSSRSSSLSQGGFVSANEVARSAVRSLGDGDVNPDNLSTNLNGLVAFEPVAEEKYSQSKYRVDQAVSNVAFVVPTAKNTVNTTANTTSESSASAIQDLDSAVSTANSETSHLPLVFILVVVLVCIVILAILLTFWCVYQKHARRPIVARQQDADRDLEATKVIGDEQSTEGDRTVGFSRIQSTENQDLPESPDNPASTAIDVHLLKPCYACFDCCLPAETFARAATDLTVLPSSAAICPSLDDSELGTGTAKVDSLPSSSAPVPVPFGKLKSAPHSVTDLTCAESSVSPSLASRRRAVPPPPLLHAVIPSILTTNPPIQTRAVPVQPSKHSPYHPESSGDANWFTHSDCPSSVATGLGMIATTPTTVSGGPVACMCSTHTALCASAGPMDSTHDSIAISRGKFMPLRFTALSSPGVASRAKFGLSSQDFAKSASPSLTKVHSAPLRARTRGLLESRRGSHTSLTLSLSPSVEIPLAPCSAGLIPVDCDARTGATLDETSVCVVSEMALPSESRPSSVAVHSESPVCPAQLAESSPDSAVVLADPEPCPHVTLESANPEFQEFKDPGEQGSHSSLTGKDLCDPMNVCLAQRLMHPLCYYLHHHHHHHRHHHHYHYHYRHHQLHGTYYRTDNNLPCPHGSQSCQRSRDVEQLMNASQPMTCEEMLIKLRDNFSSLSAEFWNIPMNHASKKDLPISGIGQKNRYQSILPNFATRVVLPMINNDPATSYINANYIRGYAGRPNAFIATQGPMSHTVSDFWRMVWHSRAPAIVMITKLVEKRDVSIRIGPLLFFSC
ncbi:Protein Tyrosine Phosphatase Receptor Type R [Fasciola hepatica]|uniref:protein-tyrosine-phosphatase n=1 Tax=Fasciola hepatica TaxID=6192 RepID=A0A4E0R2K9_FASHE|nr:Protein Tyrosine Phosphatase Receptor Type R [Fasciola hepatica]